MQDSVSLAALVVSLIALAVSAFLARRQVLLMGRANQLPLMIDLIRELRSAEFLERERYVNTRLRLDNDPTNGYSNLDPVAADHMQHVKSLFNSIGALVAFKIIEEDVAISIFGYRASRAWASMEDFIASERLARNGNYAPYFEHLVAKVYHRSPEEVTSSLKLNRVT